MPFISIALYGLFAFSGTPVAPVAASTASAIEAPAAATSTLALKDAAVVSRPKTTNAETLSVLMTSYNAVPSQTDGNPLVTAAGAVSNPEVIAARSVDLAGTLPFGTVVAIERTANDSEGCRFHAVEDLIGYRVIADSMNSRMRNKIDILLDQTDTVEVHGKEINPSMALGLCKGVTVRIVGRIKVSDIPNTQEELRKMIEGDFLAINR